MTTIALISCPIVIFVLFAKLPLRSALVWSLLLSYLLLPEKSGIDLPGLPPLQKSSIPALAISAALLLFANRKSRPQNDEKKSPLLEKATPYFTWLFICLAVGLMASMGLTIATNLYSITIGETVLQALRPWDFVAVTSDTFFMLIPFFLGRQYLARPEDHRYLLKCIVIATMWYSLPFLLEIRLSPQLHKWVYGFHQHSFIQHIRDGFRPKLFLPHGLEVGFLLFTSVLAAFSLALATKQSKWTLAALWLLLMLSISKNLGATAIALMLLPLLWMGRRAALFGVAAITLSFLAYPAVRQAGLVPVDSITQFANAISAERAGSFVYRLDNEDRLLSRAAEKPISGWGGWRRARVFNQWGQDISVTDGLWIIILGQRGWIGYICFFGLLTLPLLILPRAAKRKEIPVETIVLALIMAGNIIYLIPNSALSPIAWLIAGALAGFIQFDTAPDRGSLAIDQTPKPKLPSYTRFPAFSQR